MNVVNKTGARSISRKRRLHLSMRTREAIDAYVFMLPAILGLIFFMIGPMVVSFFLSFTEYDLLGSAEWVGLENYRTS